MEERIPFEWEEYPPESPANYRCRECGRRWHDNEVYPDPARKAWTCRACTSVCWILALAQWLLLGLVLHTFVFTGNTTGGGPGPTSNSGRWAVSLFALSVPTSSSGPSRP